MDPVIVNRWHKGMTIDKWRSYPIEQQILMIGSEFARAKNFIINKNIQEVRNCYERAFELLDLCCYDPKWRRRLKELCRFREHAGTVYIQDWQNLELNQMLFRCLLLWHPKTEHVQI